MNYIVRKTNLSNRSSTSYSSSAFGGKDFPDIHVAGVFGVVPFLGSGNDVLISSSDTWAVLNGGANADWVEGSAGNGVLFGGSGDYIITTSTRVDLGLGGRLDIGALRPNILLGGGGDNVFVATDGKPDFSVTGWNGRTDATNVVRARDTIYQMDGASEIVTGPGQLGVPDWNLGAPLGFQPTDGGGVLGITGTVAAALQDDLLRGFDSDDQIVLATSSPGGTPS